MAIASSSSTVCLLHSSLLTSLPPSPSLPLLLHFSAPPPPPPPPPFLALHTHHPQRNHIAPARRAHAFTCRSSLGGGGAPPGALTPELKEALDKFVASNKVVVFIKGTKMFPQCGFSNTVVQVLNSLNVPYEAVNILEDDNLRLGLKEYSKWPTFPQVYIDGEFFGGCDITVEAYQSGELQELLEKAMCS